MKPTLPPSIQDESTLPESFEPAVATVATALPRDVRASIGDGLGNAMMIGVAETYFPAFVLALGHDEVASGLVSTIPLLIGAVLQLFSPLGMRWTGCYRRWILGCVALQSLSLLPLAWAAYHGSFSVAAIYLTAGIYWGATLSSAPPWYTWIEMLIPPGERTHYFARRTRWSQAGTLVGFLGAGLALELGARNGCLLPVFVGVFVVGSLCRAFSGCCSSFQSHPEQLGQGQRHVPWREIGRRLRTTRDGRLIGYLLLTQATVMISGPYFIPYMLGVLKLSYARFAVLIATTYITKMVMLPAFARYAHRTSVRQLLLLGGASIIPMSVIWAFSTNFWYLIGVQFVTGVAWAAYELAALLVFFEAIPTEERTSLMIAYNLGNAVMNALGSICGGAILFTYHKAPQAFLAVFVLSTLVRVFPLAGLLWADRRAAAESASS